jgi:hypothetical protein
MPRCERADADAEFTYSVKRAILVVCYCAPLFVRMNCHQSRTLIASMLYFFYDHPDQIDVLTAK